MYWVSLLGTWWQICHHVAQADHYANSLSHPACIGARQAVDSASRAGRKFATSQLVRGDAIPGRSTLVPIGARVSQSGPLPSFTLGWWQLPGKAHSEAFPRGTFLDRKMGIWSTVKKEAVKRKSRLVADLQPARPASPLRRVSAAGQLLGTCGQICSDVEQADPLRTMAAVSMIPGAAARLK